MAIAEILASIDREIAQLTQARSLLSGLSVASSKRKPGSPGKATVVGARAKKRVLSPEGRRRIAEAQKHRWAAQRKAAAAAQK
jgi:hypothetical protein